MVLLLVWCGVVWCGVLLLSLLMLLLVLMLMLTLVLVLLLVLVWVVVWCGGGCSVARSYQSSALSPPQPYMKFISRAEDVSVILGFGQAVDALLVPLEALHDTHVPEVLQC